MNQRLLNPELELTKENLLDHFRKIAKRDLCEVWESLATAYDHYLFCHHEEMKKLDLAQMISEMRWDGQKAYKDWGEQVLLDQLWDSLVENSEHSSIDSLINAHDFLTL